MGANRVAGLMGAGMMGTESSGAAMSDAEALAALVTWTRECPGPVTLVVDKLSFQKLAACVQIALRHPELPESIAATMRQLLDLAFDGIAATHPAAAAALRRGDDPRFDRPRHDRPPF